MLWRAAPHALARLGHRKIGLPNVKAILMDMDMQKTMDFIVEQQANFHVQMSEITEKLNLWIDQSIGMEERHDREIADIRAIEASTRMEVRRAIRAGVEEQRRERVRRQALDDKLAASRLELAASRLATEQTFKEVADAQAASRLATEQTFKDLAASQLITDEKFRKLLETLSKRNGA